VQIRERGREQTITNKRNMKPIKFIYCANRLGNAYLRGVTTAGEKLSHPGGKGVFYLLPGEEVTPEQKEEISKYHTVDWTRQIAESELVEINRDPSPVLATVMEVTPVAVPAPVEVGTSEVTPPKIPPTKVEGTEWDEVPYAQLQELAKSAGLEKVHGVSRADLQAYLIEKQVEVPAAE